MLSRRTTEKEEEANYFIKVKHDRLVCFTNVKYSSRLFIRYITQDNLCKNSNSFIYRKLIRRHLSDANSCLLQDSIRTKRHCMLAVA